MQRRFQVGAKKRQEDRNKKIKQNYLPSTGWL